MRRNSWRIDYAYDGAHNRISRTLDGRTRSYTYASDSNRLVNQGRRGRKTFTYDARGNLIEDRGGKRAFAYDATNRLSAFYKDGELRARYDYDTKNMRIRKRLERPERDGAKSVRFVHELDGRLLSETTRRGDRTALRARDADARRVWSWTGADAYGGKVRDETSVDRDPDGDGRTVRIPLRFPGQYHDRESGLFHNHNRDYDPALGR